MTLEAEPTTSRGRGRRSNNTTPAPQPPNAAVDAQLDALGNIPMADLTPLDEAPAAAPAPDAPPPPPPPPSAKAAFDDFASVPDDANPFKRGAGEPPRVSKAAEKQERTENRQAKQETPSTKRMGAFGRKMPGAEHVKVEKRLDNGVLAYVGSFTNNDLSQSQDVQEFLNRYIKPSYGAGEYQLTYTDAHGRDFDGGFVTLLAPIIPSPDMPAATSPGGSLSPLALLQEVINNERRQREEVLRNAVSGQKDPVQLLKEMHELQQMFMPPMPQLKPTESGNKGADVQATMMAGMFQMMGSVLAIALAPKAPDPILTALLQNLTRPPTDSTQQLVALSEVVKNLKGPEPAKGGGDDRLIEYLLKDRMTPSEVLNLVNTVKAERGTDGLKKSMEDVGIMFNALQQLRSHTEPAVGSGFWEAVSALLANPQLTAGIASRVGNAVRQQPAQQLPPSAQTRSLPPPSIDPAVAAKARELTLRKLRLEELEIAKREEALGIKITPPPAAEQAAPSAAAAVAPAAPATTTEAPAAPVQPTANALPPNIGEHINAYLAAKTDADMVETTLEMIFDLANDEKWKAHSEMIVAFILQADRGQFLKFMAAFFVGLRSINLMEDGLARKIMDCLSRNFDTVVSATRSHIENAQKQIAEAGQQNAEDEEGEGEGDQEQDEDPLHLDE